MRKVCICVVMLTLAVLLCKAFAQPIILQTSEIELPDVQSESSTMSTDVIDTPANEEEPVTDAIETDDATSKPEAPHVHRYWSIIHESTCTVQGHIEYHCACGDVRYEGLDTFAAHNYVVTVVAATCTDAGYTKHTCTVCQQSYTDAITSPVSHKYGEWKVRVEANPLDNGTKERSCILCGNKQTDTYSFEWVDDYAIFIPATGIHAALTVGDFTQEYVNKYDVVYSEPMGADHPTVLGHNYRSLKTLYKTIVGQNIYINWNGELHVYYVVVSEHAKLNSANNNMTGVVTGHELWDSVGDETLHIFTCYKDTSVDRWLVLARRVF